MPKGLTESQVREKVEAMVVKAGSLRRLAAEWSISPAYLSDFLNGRRGPGPQILGPLGLVAETTVRYVPGEATGRRRRGTRGKEE